jgi:pyridoxamine 5'-phosphate oxidase
MKDVRRDYAIQSLDESATDPDPIRQFRTWFDEVLGADLLDPTAMSLATATAAGEPSVRTVLLKDVDQRGFVFFTHYDSQKGRELDQNPRASLLFFWPTFERQVRITGSVRMVDRAESEAYFASRPLGSQLAAWAATQSTVLPDRATLDRQHADAVSATLGRIPRRARTDRVLARPPEPAARPRALHARRRRPLDPRPPRTLVT